MKIDTKQRLAKLALFAATLIWGSSFFIMKNTIDEIGVFSLLAIRFTTAAILLAVIFYKRLAHIDRHYIPRGLLMGAFLFAAYVFQTFGLKGTTPGKNAFLTTFYCVLVPFVYWIVSKKKPHIYHLLASVICVAGIGLVSVDGGLTMGLGDGLTLVGGLFYALHIVAVAYFSKGRDMFALTVLQFASAGALGWIFSGLFETLPSSVSTASIFSLIYLCVFATAAALLLQNIGQKYTHASAASLILSLEAVFGVLFSIVFYHETLTLKTISGFALIFIAVVISETQLEFITARFKPKPKIAPEPEPAVFIAEE